MNSELATNACISGTRTTQSYVRLSSAVVRTVPLRPACLSNEVIKRLIGSSFPRLAYIVALALTVYICRTSHIFDGVTLTKETAAFQLCDILDPMLKEMIEDANDLRDVCNVGVILHSPPPSNAYPLHRNVMAGTRHTHSSASRQSCGINFSLSLRAMLQLTKSALRCLYQPRVKEEEVKCQQRGAKS
jgi:hypothetical protein